MVIAVLEGGESVRRSLAALEAQRGAPSLEAIVVHRAGALADEAQMPVDPPSASVHVRHVPVEPGPGETEVAPARLRSAGIDAARGPLVALIEDRGTPQPDWARVLVAAHRDRPGSVVGGSVAYGGRSVVGRAVFLCDYGRYEPPQEAGGREWLSDVNVSYPRSLLERLRPVWAGGYEESSVHWAVARDGGHLRLEPEACVWMQRRQPRLSTLLVERVRWGRIFGRTRRARAGWYRSVPRALLAPALPPLLYLRILAPRVRRIPSLLRVLRATPALALLLGAWSLGEAWGLLERPVQPRPSAAGAPGPTIRL